MQLKMMTLTLHQIHNQSILRREEKDDYELETEFLVPNGYLRDEEDEKEAEEMNELGVRKLPRDDEGHDLDKDTTEEDLKLGRPRLLLSL